MSLTCASFGKRRLLISECLLEDNAQIEPQWTSSSADSSALFQVSAPTLPPKLAHLPQDMDFVSADNSASGNGLRAKLLANLAALRTKKLANQPQPTANHVPSSTGEITNAPTTITKPTYPFASQQGNLATQAASLEPRFVANMFSFSNDATTTNSFDFQYPSPSTRLPFDTQFPPTIQKLLDRVGVSAPKKHLNEADENIVDGRPTFVSMQPESVLPNNNNGNATDRGYNLFPTRLHSLFANIDAILPTTQCPVPKGRNPSYYNAQMNTSSRLHSQLIDLLILPDLRDDQSAFINSYCTRLIEYIEECSRVLPMYYELDMMKISAACRQIQPILKPYDGNILNWSIFWMTYKEFIANNSILTNVAKLSLLTANLDANTRLLVNSLSEKNINLEGIHQQLEKHFEDEEVLRMEVAAALNKLPSVKSVYVINIWKNMLRSGQLSRRITNGKYTGQGGGKEPYRVPIIIG